MRCKICQNEFIPTKYRPNQQVCSRPECQKLRQLQNQRDWRRKNPEYFKYSGEDLAWQESRHRYTQLWKGVHKDYLRKYSQSHRQQRREYMREYMQNYRQKSKLVNRNKS